jgi:hypothetical protein
LESAGPRRSISAELNLNRKRTAIITKKIKMKEMKRTYKWKTKINESFKKQIQTEKERD